MEAPDNLKYTKEHEWVKAEGNMVTIGVTDYAQEQLGDVVFVELPAEGEEFSRGDALGVVESVKAVSDCYAPISGKVVEINDTLSESPEIINEDPYAEGWIVKMEASDSSEIDALLDSVAYKKFVDEEAGG